MGWKLAVKCFLKAFKNPKEGEKFLSPPEKEDLSQESPHLRFLALLQAESRLIDFLKEDISNYNDTQVGAAVRQIHQQCSKSLEEFVTLRPVFQEAEGTKVTIPAGYDTSAIKVIGHIKGAPPYQGILRHKGWKAHKLSLPKQVVKGDQSIVYPAEIEVEK